MIKYISCLLCLLSFLFIGCEDLNDTPENKFITDSSENSGGTDDSGESDEETFPTPEDHDFMSMAYLGSNMIGLQKQSPENVKSFLDQYHWEGISDVAIIKGIFMMGKDGSIITSWNKDTWPEVSSEALDYTGKTLDEQKERNALCSREVVEETVKYFKRKGVRIWFCQQGYGWLSRKTSQEITLKDLELTKKYAVALSALCTEFGCYGVDFDDEFPSEAATPGYHLLMKSMKDAGFKVGVCAQSEYSSSGHTNMDWHKIVDEGIVDHINCMQYTAGLGSNVDTNVRLTSRSKVLEAWEHQFPECFQGNHAKVSFMSGIGFYSDGSAALNMTKLYSKFGKPALTNGSFRDGNTIYNVFTTTDIMAIVQQAKDRGWGGVFTWLTSHDFTTDFPSKYSRQIALSDQVHEIWDNE